MRALRAAPAGVSAGGSEPRAVAVPWATSLRWSWRDGLALLLVWLLIVCFFWRLVTPDVAGRLYYVRGDFTWKEQAQDIVTARSWAAGWFPLWNPYIYGGQPLAADPGVGIFYPMNVLFDGTAGPDGVSLLRLEWRVIVDFLLAATLAYAFFRDIGGSAAPALGGTLLFTFSGYLTSYPPHQLDILETGTWLPLALLAVRRVAGATTDKVRRRWAVVGGLALGLAFLAGHPQTALLVVDATLAYLAYIVLRSGRWRAVLPELGVATAVALGIGAIQLIPVLEFFPFSNRTRVPDAAARLGLALDSLPGLALPHYAGQAALYVGAGGLVLAAFGVWRWWRGEGAFWAALALAALLLSLGGQTPLYPLFAHLGFGLIRDQSRAVFLTSFAVATVATIGLAEVIRTGWGRWLVLGAAVAVVIGPSITLLLQRGGDSLAAGTNDAPWTLRAGLLALVVVAMLATDRPSGRRSQLAALGLVALLATDGMAVNWNNNLTAEPPPPSDGLPRTISFLRGLPGPFRVATDGDQLIPANDLGNYGLATDQGYNDFRLAAVDDLLTSDNLWRAWQLLDVHEFLTTRTFGAPYHLQQTEQGINAYAIDGMLPDVWAVWRYQVVPDGRASLGAVLAPAFDPGQEVVLDQAPDLTVPPLPQHAQQVQEQIRSPEITTIVAQVDQPAILVRSEAWYPGWQVTVDGRPAPLLRADHALQAVAVPAGRHVVAFRFDPWSVKLGIALTALTVVGVGVMLGQTLSQKRA